MAKFKKIIAECFYRITESKKTINESPDPIAEVKKIIIKIVGSLSDEYTNKD